MLAKYAYPIICTAKMHETVAFYEDHFGFRPVFEMSCFTLMRHSEKQDLCFAFLDSNHEAVPEHYKNGVSGLILNLPVENVDLVYQQLYWEGVQILMEPKSERCGRKHFMLTDPNGILVDVMEESAKALVLDPDRNEYMEDFVLKDKSYKTKARKADLLNAVA